MSLPSSDPGQWMPGPGSSAMDHTVNLQNARNIRLTCSHAVIDGLTLDLNMVNVVAEDKSATSDAPVAPASAPAPTSAPVTAVKSTATMAAPAQAATPASSNAQLVATNHAGDGKFHLLLAASGSVATIKIPNIIRALSSQANLSIRVILTESAAKFLQGQSEEQPDLLTIASYPNVDAIYRDEDEWKVPWTRGAPILHIELRRWADLLVIAPLSANTLAKISNGLCDNLLTSVVRAWQVETPWNSAAGAAEAVDAQGSMVHQKRIVVAPAMNTAMWRHPLTALHLRAAEQDQYYHWFDVLRPIEKTLACGDTGDGAMCDWKHIVSTIEDGINAKQGPQ